MADLPDQPVFYGIIARFYRYLTYEVLFLDYPIFGQYALGPAP